MKPLLKEPLVHFLLLGAGLFLLYAWQGGGPSSPGGVPGAPSPEVVIARSDIRQMEELFRKTWQRPPTEEERQGLVESLVRDEILYREALAAGLDRDDSVIRRRLRLKMEFVFEDIAAQVEPTDAELQAYREQNAANYRIPPRIGFRQVLVSADRRGASAEAEARALLDRLRDGADPLALGDPTLLGHAFSPVVLSDIESLFGSGFAAALGDLAPGRWEGPLRSSFGWHLVRVEQRTVEHVPELTAIRAAVQRDWARERQQALKDAAYARLRERYRVVVDAPPEGLTQAEAEGAQGVRR
jgi:hypothetical protein